MSTLKAELLAKSYKGREVVKNVGLEVEAGSIVGSVSYTHLRAHET